MNDPGVLMKYVNGGCLQRSDRILSGLWSGLPFLRNAGTIATMHASRAYAPAGRERMMVEIQPYAGSNEHVRTMQESLQAQFGEVLIEAVVHGSLGTYEEISYSDFDALVILRDVVFRDRSLLVRTARRLHALQTIMYRVDPLQHHGWFVLAESDLQRFPLTYFPPELLSWSKTLLHAEGRQLEIRYDQAQDYLKPFHRLCNSLERKLAVALPRDLYAMKNLLSEFMMLPALYVEARDRKGMFKKFSFESARPDFPAGSWEPMEKVSAIRQNWRELTGPEEKIYPGVGVPSALKALLTPDIGQQMRNLVSVARKKLT